MMVGGREFFVFLFLLETFASSRGLKCDIASVWVVSTSASIFHWDYGTYQWGVGNTWWLITSFFPSRPDIQK